MEEEKGITVDEENEIKYFEIYLKEEQYKKFKKIQINWQENNLKKQEDNNEIENQQQLFNLDEIEDEDDEDIEIPEQLKTSFSEFHHEKYKALFDYSTRALRSIKLLKEYQAGNSGMSKEKKQNLLTNLTAPSYTEIADLIITENDLNSDFLVKSFVEKIKSRRTLWRKVISSQSKSFRSEYRM